MLVVAKFIVLPLIVTKYVSPVSTAPAIVIVSTCATPDEFSVVADDVAELSSLAPVLPSVTV